MRPPAISGGTLLVQKDGVTAVAADPDRDVVWVVDLASNTLLQQIPLQAGDEPGRVVEDAAGHVHVALRRGGALVSIDPRAGTILARRAVCPAPRGVAYDATLDAVHVACSDGLLATFPAAGGAATRQVRPDTDLRDVIVQNGVLYVSRFRSAELLQLAADGTIAQRTTMPSLVTPTSMAAMGPTTEVPEVAYRTVALPGGGLAMLHQRGQREAVSTDPGGYGSGNGTGGGIGVPPPLPPPSGTGGASGASDADGGTGECPGLSIVQDAISFIQPGTAPAIALPLTLVTLAVDVAVSADGTQIAIAAPGSNTVGLYAVATLQTAAGPLDCAPPPSTMNSPSSQAIAVAFDGQGRLVSQSREPASIVVAGNVITLPGASAADDGHAFFHAGTMAGIACASCHPEGGDDGRVWQFSGLGARRTQNLQGGVLARTPFHWSGDIPDMDALVSVVFVGRMDGSMVTEEQTLSLGTWMDAQAALAPPPPADPAAVARGATTFNDPTVGCTSCHSGPELSNHALVDVGTGGTFKVPSLIGVGYRAPYLHDGCAATLNDRFGSTCGGGEQHGHTAQLGASQITDLVAYLQSL